ncbi:hypothetical protein F4825DRAFT_445824 [Nemania diffusa]|nr:hypothetical protein F4825DRAFT_445824 [Nemania diffusa]
MADKARFNDISPQTEVLENGQEFTLTIIFAATKATINATIFATINATILTPGYASVTAMLVSSSVSG